MTIKVAELHNVAMRIAPGPDAAGAALRFYGEVLGLERDHVPWDRDDDGQRINAGPNAQLRLLPGHPARLLAPGELDFTGPHFALAVASIDEAQAELDSLGIPYRIAHGRLGPESKDVRPAGPPPEPCAPQV